MGAEALSTVLGWFGHAFSWSGLSGVSLALVAAGFMILFSVLVIGAAILVVRTFKNIANMTVGQFIVFITVLAFVMIIVGAAMP